MNPLENITKTLMRIIRLIKSMNVPSSVIYLTLKKNKLQRISNEIRALES